MTATDVSELMVALVTSWLLGWCIGKLYYVVEIAWTDWMS